MARDDVETEAKWRLDEAGHERLRQALRRLGATRTGAVSEANTLFDSPGEPLRLSGRVLRLRWLDDGRGTLTFKGPAKHRGGIKTRAESELEVGDREAVVRILNGLGFAVSLEYAKTRELWDFGGVVIALDSLEFGEYVEIEGARDEIQRVARLLDLDLAKAERRGYPSLARNRRARQRDG